jgi:hypothetical protein
VEEAASKWTHLVHIGSNGNKEPRIKVTLQHECLYHRYNARARLAIFGKDVEDSQRQRLGRCWETSQNREKLSVCRPERSNEGCEKDFHRFPDRRIHSRVNIEDSVYVTEDSEPGYRAAFAAHSLVQQVSIPHAQCE